MREEDLYETIPDERDIHRITMRNVEDHGPSWTKAGASSPLAEDVSFAKRSPPRDKIAFFRASALAAADMVKVFAGSRMEERDRGRILRWHRTCAL